MNILTWFLLIMASLIGIVGSLGLTGTMSMNVLGRTRETGIMRAIGASHRVVTNQVIHGGDSVAVRCAGPIRGSQRAASAQCPRLTIREVLVYE